jgi:hypothetical protein
MLSGFSMLTEASLMVGVRGRIVVKIGYGWCVSSPSSQLRSPGDRNALRRLVDHPQIDPAHEVAIGCRAVRRTEASIESDRLVEQLQGFADRSVRLLMGLWTAHAERDRRRRGFRSA